VFEGVVEGDLIVQNGDGHLNGLRFQVFDLGILVGRGLHLDIIHSLLLLLAPTLLHCGRISMSMLVFARHNIGLVQILLIASTLCDDLVLVERFAVVD
jgi:hypothetical protein